MSGEAAVLRDLLAALTAVELAWDETDQRVRRIAELRAKFVELRSRDDAPDLVASLADRLVDDLDLRHLTALTVPVERALDRRVRDEDLLPVTDDPSAEPDLMDVRLVADSLRSSFNVGGLFRTAECFGVREIVLTGYSAGPDDRRVAKAALGTADLVPWRRLRRAGDAIEEFRVAGVETVALETADRAVPLADAEIGFPCAVLVGNERFGLMPSTVDRVDRVVRIPMHGRKNSLNVVSACSVCLSSLRERWRG